MPIIWGQDWTDEDVRAYARQQNNERTVEQRIYKEIFSKLLGEVKQGKTISH